MANSLKFTKDLKRQCQLNLWRPFLLAEAICFRRKRSIQLKLYSFQRKPFHLVEVISSRGGHSFQWKAFFQRKPFLLVRIFPVVKTLPSVEVAPLFKNYSFQWKPLLLVETIFYSVNHSFQWKPYLLEKAISFSRGHSLQQKPFILMETIAPSGRQSFQWKPFLLVEAIPFSSSHSF